MKNLGKIIFLLFTLSQIVYAGVVASVDSDHVGYGEVVTYNLTLSGEDVKRPDIYTLCGEDVIGTGSSTSIQVINGDYQKSYVLSYKFVPIKSCTIEALEVEIEGTKHQTQSIDIVVEKIIPSKDDDFLITLSSNKDEVYVGEEFDLTLLFRQKKSAQAVDSKFVKPDFKGFWVKGEPKQEIIKEAAHVSTKVIFKMAPQREGTLNIESAQISIASRQNIKNYWGGFFPEVKWKTYFSNELNITSKALPNDVSLVGSVMMEAYADKTIVNPNEAVNVTIKVVGDANLEDIKSFKPYINGISIFDEKIEIKENILTQKITFVADESFKVPSFSLKIFNPETQEIKTIFTKVIDITVNHSQVVPKEELVIKKDEKVEQKVVKKDVVEEKIGTAWLVIIFIFGLILGVLIMSIKPFFALNRKKKFDVKNHKMLLIKLIPFKENQDVKEIVDVIENNLYSDKKQDIDKKSLNNVIKKYDIR